MKTTSHPSKLPFMKMHGLGNDFVVVDLRNKKFSITENFIKSISDRHRGIGFDQLAVINDHKTSDLHLTFYNADGSKVSTCGNATRCVARYEMVRLKKSSLNIMTEHGLLQAAIVSENETRVNMGHPLISWNEIPLSKEVDTLELPLDGKPTATSMGNPHCTFFVKNAEEIELEDLGPLFENNSLFPEGTNVQVVSLLAKNHLRMRVWERGVGHTLASGSSACASAVAAARKGLTGKTVKVDLDGGQLQIDWQDSGVWMSGPTRHVFSGELSQEFLDCI
jgi:diaminopimelate epimerase